MPTYRRSAILAGLPLVLATGGCTSLLGDFSSSGQGSTKDASNDVNVGDGFGGSSGGLADANEASSTGEDGSTDGPTGDGSDDAPLPPPPPAAGKPGFDITAGGHVSVSINYKLTGAVGESPGGNVVSHSTNYTLKGGVIAGTQ